MNYAESVAYIESLAPTLLNPDLLRFATFMEEQGNPQDKYPTLHIAGTNGKGSSVAICESVLRAAGFRTGRFTGPHLLRWNERFQICGVSIDDHRFSELATSVRMKSEEFGRKHPQLGSLTWFEFLTALAFFWFEQERVEVGIIEVGLGGRWDATNVLTKPLVTAITTIGFDHTHILGDTLPLIAGEKAGIIKSSVPVVTAAAGEAFSTIEARAAEMQAPLFHVTVDKTVRGPENIDLKPFVEALSELQLKGKYQELNALVSFVALHLAEQRGLGRAVTAHAADGFRDVYWPGRFQFIPGKNLLLDGAHNVSGAQALRRSLDGAFPQQAQRIFVLSFFENKDVHGALLEMLRAGDRVIISEADVRRAKCPKEQILAWAEEIGASGITAPTIADAFHLAQEHSSSNDLIVATGSLATVKETMLAMGWHSVEDGLAEKT